MNEDINQTFVKNSNLNPSVISLRQIKLIKWRTYFWGFAFWFFLSLFILGFLAYFCQSLSIKINNHEINFLLFKNWKKFINFLQNKNNLIFVIAFSVFYLTWPIIITIKSLFTRTKIPKFYDAHLLTSIVGLKKQYGRHCVYFWFFWALPIFLLFGAKIRRYLHNKKKFS